MYKTRSLCIRSYSNLASNASRDLLKFVPKSKPVDPSEIEKLKEFVLSRKRLFVISGAGVSTESGIPDYRSEGVGLYARTDRRPVQHAEFMKSAEKRRSYWARNYVSWPIFSSFQPNINHHIMAKWERRNKVHHHVTQNVDSLLVKAGCTRLTELHGNSYKVRCMDCRTLFTREATQILIASQNKGWYVVSDLELSPDNDVLLTDEQIREFKTPQCPICKMDRLKPEVVFFGDNIAKDVVDFTKSKLHESDGILALGTSLQVYSAYRFILYARDLNLPIAILNIGPTRGDQHASIKLDGATCSHILQQIDNHV